MIKIRNKHPENRAHFSRLLEFCKEVIAICRDLDIEPVLNGSLAVFGYTQNQAMRVNDIDLACSEPAFPNALPAPNVVRLVLNPSLLYTIDTIE